MPAVTRSLISDDFEFGHGADDGEHCPTHGAVGIDLILDADEAHAELVELLERSQQVACVAGEAIGSVAKCGSGRRWEHDWISGPIILP